MVKRADMPSFGVLEGCKVVVAAVSTAGPFAGSLFADNGADVIWLESPKGLDSLRWTNNGWGVENERRNMRTIMLDVRQPEGKEVFLKLREDTDIFIEASRDCQWDTWGYSDEALWEVNPKLVIGHMSGYGQTGDPEYTRRAGYDPTVLAFSGLMYLNGFEDSVPLWIQKFVTDYYAGLFAYGSALAGYVKALKTGTGDSFDLAQYEATVRCQAGQFGLWFEGREQVVRGYGAPSTLIGPAGYFECGDGAGINMLCTGPGPVKALCDFLGFEYGSEFFPEGVPGITWDNPISGTWEQAIKDYCMAHTADEVDREFARIGVPCAVVMNYEMMENHPHYLARETWTEWDTVNGKHIKGVNAVPRWKNSPTQIWRGCPSQGMDNDDILGELGIEDEAAIADLYEKGVLRKTDYVSALK